MISIFNNQAKLEGAVIFIKYTASVVPLIFIKYTASVVPLIFPPKKTYGDFKEVNN